jgi:hypothetical protein
MAVHPTTLTLGCDQVKRTTVGLSLPSWLLRGISQFLHTKGGIAGLDSRQRRIFRPDWFWEHPSHRTGIESSSSGDKVRFISAPRPHEGQERVEADAGIVSRLFQ